MVDLKNGAKATKVIYKTKRPSLLAKLIGLYDLNFILLDELRLRFPSVVQASDSTDPSQEILHSQSQKCKFYLSFEPIFENNSRVKKVVLTQVSESKKFSRYADFRAVLNWDSEFKVADVKNFYGLSATGKWLESEAQFIKFPVAIPPGDEKFQRNYFMAELLTHLNLQIEKGFIVLGQPVQ